MAKIKIKNFGPIKNGLQNNDGFIVINKVTIFIGNQGSGKSTIAKLISTLSWLEKAILKGQVKINQISSLKKFIKYSEYQNIHEYFREDTVIEYKGNTLYFTLNKGDITIKLNHYGLVVHSGLVKEIVKNNPKLFILAF